MKLKSLTPVILLIILAVSFAGISCVDQSVKKLGTEAVLTSLDVQSERGQTPVTDTVSKVAAPIPADVMEKEDITAADLYGTDYNEPDTTIGWADIRVADKDTGKITGRIRPKISKGASAKWGVGTRSTRPDKFEDTRVPATLDNDEYIYIKVTSEDGLKTQYYRFYTKLMSWTTNLQYIRLASREGTAGANVHGQSSGGSSWDKALGRPSDDKNTDGTPKSYTPLTFSIAQREGQNAVVEAVPFDPNATVKYCLMANETTEPVNFTPSDQPINITDQSYLYVEVTAENTLDKEYFKFLVSVGRIASISSLKFNDGTKDIDIYGLGLPQPTWGAVGPGEYQTANQPAGGFTIKLVTDDPDATKVWERINNASAAEPTSYNSSATIRFTNDSSNVPQVLAIKVVSANGIVTQYYKIRVMNLAANITAHPKSAWYYRDDIKASGVSAEGKKAKVALTVVLDPPAPVGGGTYTYQWYESDSWYGIYGRHGTSLDEKNNITTVNGGPGQYFNLVQPDETPYTLTADGYPNDKYNGNWNNWPGSNRWHWADYSRGGEPMAWTYTGPGAATASITPRTDWVDDTANMSFHGTASLNSSFPVKPDEPKVNFLSGSTNESRYYWVKVTDPNTGLTVTSDRALIITETDPNMDHFIFDLSVLPKKNIVPFKKSGTAYDNVYKIDLKDYPFPSDFETKVGNYQICIAHAQYFLPDGRPWTQNWTHGNLHFGLDDGSLTWWHNNMGANGGSIPLQAPHSSQGGLTTTPQWIGFTPSGDPAKGLPRPVNAAGDLPKGIYSMDAKDPYPAGVAQGYFAAFIELLEIRFQTAPQ